MHRQHNIVNRTTPSFSNSFCAVSTHVAAMLYKTSTRKGKHTSKSMKSIIALRKNTAWASAGRSFPLPGARRKGVPALARVPNPIHILLVRWSKQTVWTVASSLRFTFKVFNGFSRFRVCKHQFVGVNVRGLLFEFIEFSGCGPSM